MNSLPLAIHTAAQVRALDRHAVERLNIPGYTLMTRAAEAALRTLRSCWPQVQRVAVVCGAGNNGGDGYVLARLARAQRLEVDVMALSDPKLLQGDARRAWEDFTAAGGSVSEWRESRLRDADVLVDAIFGTGLSRPLDAQMCEWIQAINDSRIPILALDVPSGLHADTGASLGAVVMAERTIAFVGLKLGYYLGEGPNCTGILTFDGLDLPAEAAESVGYAALRIEEHALARLLPRRRRTTHKGQQGHVLVIGGNLGMAGAARLAGEAALRVGAGLVTVATRQENVASVVAQRPELICRGVERAEDLGALLDRADVLAMGPGMGQDAWAASMFEAALAREMPTVLDADALNLLARTSLSRECWILTPHPGEAGRLLGTDGAAVQRDRLGSANAIAKRYGGVTVLKGAGTLVVARDALPAICDQGNPGMASPGMGDVLTGVIAGIAAQTSDLAGAARAGVLVHAMAGDMSARRGERGMLATDLFTYLPTCVNPTQRF
jgi:NAD(P)H-hydrate epimerase